MRDLELYIPTQIFSSHGAVKKLGATCLQGKTRVLLITNNEIQEGGALKEIRRNAEAGGIELIVEPEVSPFSTEEVVDSMLKIARISYVEGVIGFGDITALSVARAVAMLHCSDLSAGDLAGNDRQDGPASHFHEERQGRLYPDARLLRWLLRRC